MTPNEEHARDFLPGDFLPGIRRLVQEIAPAPGD